MNDYIKLTPYMDEYNASISERVYHIKNNLSSYPMCTCCGDWLYFNETLNRYPHGCSFDCIMQINELTFKDKLIECFRLSLNQYKGNCSRMLQRHDQIYQGIMDLTSNLPLDIPFNQRCYCLIKDIKEKPICSECGNSVKFRDFNKGFDTYCCKKCSANAEATQDKLKATNLERYGVEHSINNVEVRDRYESTMLNIYGVSNPLASNEVRQKIAKTNITKFGSEFPTQNEKIKAKLSNLKALEYEDPKTGHILRSYEAMLDLHHVQKKSIAQIANELNVSITCISKWLNDHGISKKRHTSQNSIDELELIAIIKEWFPNIQILSSNRTIIAPYEIDIYLPELNIGIEFNGVYYHSTAFNINLDPYRHQRKTLRAAQAGVRLITIFEDDYWNNWYNYIEPNLKAALFGKLPQTKDLLWGLLPENIVKPISFPNSKCLVQKQRVDRDLVENPDNYYQVFDCGSLE